MPRFAGIGQTPSDYVRLKSTGLDAGNTRSTGSVNMVDMMERHARLVASAQFDEATRRAFMERILSKFRGKTDTLLPFDEVMRALGFQVAQRPARTPQTIPLDKIVGSVGRYRDFTRTFLPTENVNKERWVRVASLLEGPGWPPIHVYKVGDVYFVQDGNHRVSVARSLGMKEIEAYVTELQLPPGVEITPETDLKGLMLQLGRARFLERTRLHELRPDVRIEVTEPGLYNELLEHIDVHRYYLGLEQDRYIPYQEAVLSFVDNVYLPVVQEIRASGIMRNFPQRTEADLYLWIARHRERLREKYGLPAPPSPKAAVTAFAEQHSERPLHQLVRQVKHALALTPREEDLIRKDVEGTSEDESTPHVPDT